MTIRQLKEKLGGLAKHMHALNESNKGAAWTPEIQTQWDGLLEEHGRVEAEIRRLETLERVSEDEVRLLAAAGANGQRPVDEPRQSFRNWLRGGDQAVSAEEWRRINATMSTTTGSEGGHTVPTTVANEVLEALKAYGGMREVATLIRTEMGNPMNFPTSDGTAEVGEIIAENQTATGADPVFGVAAVNPYKYSSKIVACPFELLQDSGVDIEAFIRNRLVARLGRITNTHFTTGDGSAKPHGAAARATLGKTGANGQTASVIYDDLVDLVHAVDPAYRRGARFMMADSSIKVIKKLKDSANRPIWLPSYDAGLSAGQPETLLGYRLTVNQDVAAMAASARSILFGDFSYYVIRDVMAITMFRFTDSAYAKLGQVGFLAWMRSGGNLLDTAAVKYYGNAAT